MISARACPKRERTAMTDERTRDRTNARRRWEELLAVEI